MKIAKISIKRPTVVVVIFLTLAFFGVFTLLDMNQELMPERSTNVISVSTLYPGAGAYEVENSITKKIEDAVSSQEGIDKMMATSMENMSLVTIQLKPSVNVDKALQDVQRKVNAIVADLPEEAEEPSVTDFRVSDIPIMTIGVISNTDETELYDLVDREIKPMLERIPGVGRINLVGGQEREIQVNINEERLQAYGLPLAGISQILVASNLDFPTGKIINTDEQVQIRLEGKYNTITDIENVVLHSLPDGTVIKTKDIAEVSDTYKEITTISRINGIPGVGITIQRSADANTVNISKNVKNELEYIKEQYQELGLDFIIAADNAEFTLESSRSVMIDLVMAVILVALCMLLFLQSIRNSLFAAIAIPLSLVASFIPMYLFGFSLNIMTLLALTLVIGILVDDAIVVIENIHRHMEMGKKPVQAAYDGVKEIGFTVISMTLVLVVVFIPISLTQGAISEVFRQFSATIAIAVIFSLLVSFMVVPLLYSRFGKLEKPNTNTVLGRFISSFENVIEKIAHWFRNLLYWSLSHKLVVLTVTFIFLIASIALLPLGFIGSDVAPQGDQGQFMVNIELPRNSTISQTNMAVFQAENIIRSHPAIENIFTTVGAEENGQAQARLAELRIKLIPHDQRSVSSDELSREIRLTLQRNIPDAKITISMADIMGNIEGAPIQYYISGQNMDSVRYTANLILENIRVVKGVIDPEISSKEGNPQISIIPDREKMARLGISFENLGFTLSTAFSGNTDGKFRDRGKEYDINIKLDMSDRERIENVENISLINTYGEIIKLKQFATIEQTEGPTLLERRNRTSAMTLSSRVGGRPIGDVGSDIDKVIAQLDIPENVIIQPGGELEVQDESFGSLGFALIISILLVYLIMVILYDSYVYPFVILTSIPLAVIGALMALALTMETLNVFTILGMIVLIGLVAKNAILVVDFTNQMKAEGMELKAALLEATHKRFRPIIMTTLATIIGMLPVALSTGAAAEWKNGLAWVIIGGLVSSMFLTLIIVPIFYYIMDKILMKFGWDRKKEIAIEG